MSLNPRQLEAFGKVMATGSMTVAAEILTISQPAVSRLIRDLERSIGVKLFLREGNRLIPTAEAKRLFGEVNRLHVGLERVERVAQDLKGLREGTLRIASESALSLSVLTEGLVRFVQKRPDVAISLDVRPSSTVLEMVAINQFDVGFAHVGPQEYPGLKVTRFSGAEAKCMVPATHRLAQQDEVHLSDLEGEHLISVGANNPLRVLLERTLEALGVNCKRLLQTTLAYSACAMVEGGLGIAICDPFTATYCRYPGVVSKRLVPPLPFDFAMVMPAYEAHSRAQIDFSQTMSELFWKVFLPRVTKPATAPLA